MSSARTGRSIGTEFQRSRPLAWLLPLAAIAAAVAYGQQWTFGSKCVSILFKAMPALAMAAEVVRQRGLTAWTLTLALLLHGAGDALLDGGRSWLLAGMAAFFLGHLAYVATYLPHRIAWSELRLVRRGAIAWLAAAMLALSIWIWPRLPMAVNIASPIYTVALTAMACAALMGRWPDLQIPIGAILFVASDTLLGLRMFAEQERLAWLIWPTYVAAQILMPLGYLRALALEGARAATSAIHRKEGVAGDDDAPAAPNAGDA
jgi:uncharacterized membrane protein YhhN